MTPSPTCTTTAARWSGQLRDLLLGLPEEARGEVAALLNQVLSDTRILHDLYKKSHWLMRGATFY